LYLSFFESFQLQPFAHEVLFNDALMLYVSRK